MAAITGRMEIPSDEFLSKCIDDLDKDEPENKYPYEEFQIAYELSVYQPGVLKCSERVLHVPSGARYQDLTRDVYHDKEDVLQCKEDEKNTWISIAAKNKGCIENVQKTARKIISCLLADEDWRDKLPDLPNGHGWIVVIVAGDIEWDGGFIAGKDIAILSKQTINIKNLTIRTSRTLILIAKKIIINQSYIYKKEDRDSFNIKVYADELEIINCEEETSMLSWYANKECKISIITTAR